MKPKFGREIALLSLPVLLMGGWAWWQSAGAPGKSRFSLAQSIANKRRPTLRVEKVEARWFSPYSLAEFQRGGDCQVIVTVIPSHGILQQTPKNRPHVVWMDVVDEKNRSLSAVLSRPRRIENQTWRGIPFSVSWPTPQGNQAPDSYSLVWEIPFAHVPAATQSLHFKARVAWGTSRAVPIEFEVMPTWMRRPPQRFKIEKIAWQTGKTGEAGRVVVDLKVPRATSWRLFDRPTGIFPGMEYSASDYEPFARNQLPLKPGEARLIASWSQRIESGDGKFNSLNGYHAYLKAEETKAWRAARRAGGNEISVPSGGFAPNPVMHFTAGKNGTARLEYIIKEISKTAKNPVFRAEIWVEGDGKREIICPLSPKPLR